ncbi:hypothetical protein QYE76_023708 [Lolium multiflorum]|uniref:Gag-pol polyprotein n=1 Tax=Lolium multiflorum TaxID=4521 RepID=A0AAD8RCN6_LOLMU|nr:hypothetical protein QYE76_023708 [Lolium multiflorum]
MLVMTGHAKKLSDLGIVIPNRLGINRVLQSLPPSYKNFVMNYNMQNMNKEFPELFGMLKAAEIEIKKEHQVLMVNKTTSFKKQGKSKGKFKKGGKKAATPPMKPKNGPKPDADCYYCKEKGHWKRNCSKYLADLKSGLVKKKKEVTMRVGNGSKVNVIAVGTLPLHLPSGLVLSLNNCYYVPALSMNIISGSCLMQDDLDSSDTHIHNIDAKRIKLNDNSTYMWHCRLGHIGVKRMKKLHTDGLLESLDFESLDRCEACLMGKMTKTPFSGMMERATDLLEIIHTDVCGPMSVASRGGYRYVLTFTDDLSRYGYIYLMKHKSETFEKFKEFQSEVENQRNKKIKFLRSDRGGEYLSYEFGMHLKKCGILSQLTPPGTPQRNGVSERRNRTLLDMVRSMMSLTDLPLSFWSYALETAAFTLNRAPSKSVETTPYELWFNKKPKLSFLKVWGCEAYVKKLQPDKLEPKAEKCVFIGYPKETIGKVELDEIEESLLVDQSSAVPENVPVPPTPTTEEANDNDHETSNETATEPRRSTRDRATPDWYDPCLNVMIVDNNDEDPATYEEAMMSPDSNKWQEAMKSEMGSMYDNKVWTLVDLPDSRKAVENKWIFKRKTDADGNITVYKARLVAKGFRQIQGVDYDETFSPVAKLKSVRILLAIAAFFDYEIWQMDVKTAFLNGDIEEELYMVQPKGFVDPKNADKVCKLQRSIYGLKQASRSWNRRFDKVIKDFGFIQCHGEACIYKKVSGSSVAFLILYVDDILLIGNDIELLSSVKGYLNNSFSMKDLGEASYILGIKIYRDRSRRLIGLSQSTYLDKILKKFRMDESKKGFLPMLPGKVLSKTQGPATAEERERMSQIPYASAVGSIMYAMLCTRPDIAHAVSLTSRYQSDPGMEHWTAVKNILKYLKRTKDMFLCYGGDQELVVTSYTDAISWASSKQCTVAKSSTESEYIAASEASSEAVWMKRFIVELGVVPSALDPFVIYCDNMGAIANAQEPRSHKRLKHIKLRYHSIREYIEDGEENFVFYATMTVCHMLLGRPWQFDKKAIHDGFSNAYTFKVKDKKFELRPMTPSQIIADNAKALARAQHHIHHSELRGEGATHQKESERHHPHMSERKSVLLATKSEWREVKDNPSTTIHYVLICKGLAEETNDLTNIPSSLLSLLKEFQDVFPDELPHGLPPLRGIEHRIDLIPGAPLPNRAAYRTNPEDTKEIQRQIQDLLAKGKNLEDHVQHVREVLCILRHEKLFANLPKCHFAQNKLVFLGFVVSANGIEVDSSKVEAIHNWPTPTNVGQVRSFHGLAGFYRRFVKDFSTIACPLNELTKKNVPFVWGKAQQKAFDELKKRLTEAPLLALPDFTKTFEIECDASGLGIGGVLMQNGKPVAYYSEKLDGARLNYPIYDKELYALCSVDRGFDDFYLHDGYLFKANKICIPESSLRKLLLQESHGGGLMGHFGREKTYAMLSTHYYWPRMYRDVERLCRRCTTCLQAKEVVRLHGVPASIVSDRDVKFMSYLWKSLMAKFGVKLLFSSSSHPQTDGQTEVVNRSLSTLLRTLVKTNLKSWEDCLPHAEFAYNRAKHSTTSRSPFMIVYGFEPPTALDILPLPLHERTNMDFDERTTAMKKLHEETRATIQEHVLRQANRLNAKKKERVFEEGDLVWIHLRKERFPQERNSKLKPRGDGPFKVLKRINNNAYVIDIPTSKYLVSNTFNISDLSPYHGDEEEQESRTTLSQGGEMMRGGLRTPPHQDRQVPQVDQ